MRCKFIPCYFRSKLQLVYRSELKKKRNKKGENDEGQGKNGRREEKVEGKRKS